MFCWSNATCAFAGIRVAMRCQRLRGQNVVALKKLDAALSKNTTRMGDDATMSSYLRAMTSAWSTAFGASSYGCLRGNSMPRHASMTECIERS